MPNLSQLPLPDDRVLMDFWMEEYSICSMTAADELGVFAALENGALAPPELSSRLQLGEEALAAICRVLVSLGLLSPEGGRFGLTDLSRSYWVPSSPLFRREEFLLRRETMPHKRIVQTAREGWSPAGLGPGQSFTEMWEKGTVTREAAERFTKKMHSLIFPAALAAARSGAFAGVARLIDAGGGSGAFCIAATAHEPKLKAVLMDLAPVCEAAQSYIQRWGDPKRIEARATNFFQDPWPTDGDAFCFSNILHDWRPEVCAALLKKTFDALPPGGKLFVHEALLDESGCGPRAVATFGLLMHVNHRAQQFTETELGALIRGAGFKAPAIVHRFGYYSLVVAKK